MRKRTQKPRKRTQKPAKVRKTWFLGIFGNYPWWYPMKGFCKLGVAKQGCPSAIDSLICRNSLVDSREVPRSICKTIRYAQFLEISANSWPMMPYLCSFDTWASCRRKSKGLPFCFVGNRSVLSWCGPSGPNGLKFQTFIFFCTFEGSGCIYNINIYR